MCLIHIFKTKEIGKKHLKRIKRTNNYETILICYILLRKHQHIGHECRSTSWNVLS